MILDLLGLLPVYYTTVYRKGIPAMQYYQLLMQLINNNYCYVQMNVVVRKFLLFCSEDLPMALQDTRVVRPIMLI